MKNRLENDEPENFKELNKMKKNRISLIVITLLLWGGFIWTSQAQDRSVGRIVGKVINRETKEPAGKESYRFVEEGFKRGVQFGHAKYGGMGNVVKIKPPMVITESEADRVMEVFEEVTQLLSA